MNSTDEKTLDAHARDDVLFWKTKTFDKACWSKSIQKSQKVENTCIISRGCNMNWTSVLDRNGIRYDVFWEEKIEKKTETKKLFFVSLIQLFLTRGSIQLINRHHQSCLLKVAYHFPKVQRKHHVDATCVNFKVLRDQTDKASDNLIKHDEDESKIKRGKNTCAL